MIEITKGDLLQADVEALVNTVNTVGVMGKGIALQFKQTYPENYKAYRAACHSGNVQIGTMFIFSTGTLRACLKINERSGILPNGEKRRNTIVRKR